MDLEDLLNQMLRHSIGKKEGKFITKLDKKEQLRFFEVFSRKKAFANDCKRVISKFEAEHKRIWFDIEDKYNLHGKALFYNSEEGNIYEEQ